MNKELKTAFIVIVILAILYYLLSPYQNCVRRWDKTLAYFDDRDWANEITRINCVAETGGSF